jgi:hypothetical protein
MTYKELIRRIETIAINQPTIASIVRDDVYLLNTEQAAKYGVFAWTQNTHRAEAVGDEAAFSFNLFYIDRLSDGDANRVDIYATGMATLTNIIRTLGAEAGVGSYTLQPFTQKFLDRCAGVFATITISAEVDNICAAIFEAEQSKHKDFNDDFNMDFY